MSDPGLRPVELLDPANHDCDGFYCGVPELDQWLLRTAPVAAVAGTAATWVLCRGRQVVGYFALAMGSVRHVDAPSRLRRGQPDPVPVLVLAKLALHRPEQATGLGADLLRDALIRAIAGAHQFGARSLVVDAIDDRAFSFYQHHGFLPFPGQQRLYRRIEDLERSVGASRASARTRPRSAVIVIRFGLRGALPSRSLERRIRHRRFRQRPCS